MDISTYNLYDVYYATLPKPKGSEQSGIRPIVIYNISDYDYVFFKNRMVFQCFALTTEHKNDLPVHFHIKANKSCLKEDSIFLAEQAFILYEEHFLNKIGNIEDKEYRYMIYKTTSKALGKTETIFKYSNDFLIEAKKTSEFLKSAWCLLKENTFRLPETRNLLKSEVDSEMDKLRSICKKHKVTTSKYITDLSIIKFIETKVRLSFYFYVYSWYCLLKYIYLYIIYR